MEQPTSSGMREAIIVFNLLPATYADPSWFAASAPWCGRLAGLQSPAARSVLSDWLLDRYDLTDCHDFEFAQVEKAMFLQGPKELQTLSATVGLLRHRAALRRMVGGGILARLGQELGADMVEQGLVSLPLPDTLPPPDSDFDHHAEHLLPQLVASGMPWLLGFLRPEWRAVAMRARLKFSRELAALPPILLEGAARDISLRYLQVHLLKMEAL